MAAPRGPAFRRQELKSQRESVRGKPGSVFCFAEAPDEGFCFAVPEHIVLFGSLFCFVVQKDEAQFNKMSASIALTSGLATCPLFLPTIEMLKQKTGMLGPHGHAIVKL